MIPAKKLNTNSLKIHVDVGGDNYDSRKTRTLKTVTARDRKPLTPQMTSQAPNVKSRPDLLSPIGFAANLTTSATSERAKSDEGVIKTQPDFATCGSLRVQDPTFPPVEDRGPQHTVENVRTAKSAKASQTSFAQALLDARRERRAIRQAGGSDGISWVSKVTAKTCSIQDLREDEFEDLKARPSIRSRVYAPPRLFHSVASATSSEAKSPSDGMSIILAEKKLPRLPPLSPATATSFGVNKNSVLMSPEELADDARRRALAVEQAALEQIKSVRELQKRLEFELSEANRRGRERSEAEAAARAKWAKDQAQRNALDAYERSKLEHEERQRRAKVEATRLEEELRAQEVRAEKQRAEDQEREVLEEARKRQECRRMREERLKEEVQHQASLKAERQERKRLAAEQRKKLVQVMREKLEGTDEGTPVLDGLLRAQLGEGKSWRTRYFELHRDAIVLFKSQRERDSPPPERLELSQYLRNGSESMEDNYEYCLAPNSCLLRFEKESTSVAAGTALEVFEVTVAFPSNEDREIFLAALEVTALSAM